MLYIHLLFEELKLCIYSICSLKLYSVQRRTEAVDGHVQAFIQQAEVVYMQIQDLKLFT